MHDFNVNSQSNIQNHFLAKKYLKVLLHVYQDIIYFEFKKSRENLFFEI